MLNLKAKYTFVSPSTNNTYVLHVQTGPLTNPIITLDNPNCIGWTILEGTFITIIEGKSTTYNVKGGQTTFIYNGLWQSASSSPDGPGGSPWCQGIDRLFISVTSESGNTSIFATDNNTITIAFEGVLSDTATLVSSIFPPQ
jgi:hypothetical protein